MLHKKQTSSGRPLLGRLLKKYRAAQGRSLRDLSEALDGIWKVATLSKYERGDRTPSADFLVRVSKALGLSSEETKALKAAWIDDQVIRLNREYNEAVYKAEAQALGGVLS